MNELVKEKSSRLTAGVVISVIISPHYKEINQTVLFTLLLQKSS